MNDNIEVTTDMVITLVFDKNGEGTYRFSTNELTMPFAFAVVSEKMEEILAKDDQKARLKKNRTLPKTTVLLNKKVRRDITAALRILTPVLIECHKELFAKYRLQISEDILQQEGIKNKRTETVLKSLNYEK